jgi:hypothetical protein
VRVKATAYRFHKPSIYIHNLSKKGKASEYINSAFTMLAFKFFSVGAAFARIPTWRDQPRFDFIAAAPIAAGKPLPPTKTQFHPMDLLP